MKRIFLPLCLLLTSCQDKSDVFATLPEPTYTVYNTGWPELPFETSETDYHYAYHMRADAPELRNYSVCFSAEKCCPVWTAHAMHPSWDKNVNRNEKWTWDHSIVKSIQPDLSRSYQGSFNRGHMVASEDRQISIATNEQTFYFTNSAPQIQNEFNAGVWRELEQRIQKDWNCDDTLYVVTGSHWDGELVRTCTDIGGKIVQVPSHFYKVLVRTKAGNTRKSISELPASEIKCIGIWLRHDSSYDSRSKNKLKSEYLKSVTEIEQLTDLTFFANIPNAPKESFLPADWGFAE